MAEVSSYGVLQDEDTELSLAQLVREPHGIATVAFEVISTAAMLPFIYIEVCTISEYGFMGWLDFWCALAPSPPSPSPSHVLIFSWRDRWNYRNSPISAILLRLILAFIASQVPKSPCTDSMLRSPLHCQRMHWASLIAMTCRNVMDMGAYWLQAAIVILHLGRLGLDSNELSVVMAIQVLVLWIKVQYYAR